MQLSITQKYNLSNGLQILKKTDKKKERSLERSFSLYKALQHYAVD